MAVKKVKVRKKSPKKAERYAPIYRDIEDSFQTFFGTKVKLDAGERKGKIIIQYNKRKRKPHFAGARPFRFSRYSGRGKHFISTCFPQRTV